MIDRSRLAPSFLYADLSCVLARGVAHHLAPVCAARRAQVWAMHRHQHRLRDYLRARNVAGDASAPGYRKRCAVIRRWRCLRRVGVSIVEMGVEEKMAPEDQNGGYSHPTLHRTSSDLGGCFHTSWTDSMAILTGVGPREQVLVSTSPSTTLHFPPRSGCLAVAVDRAVLWPQVGAGGWHYAQ